MGYIHITYIHLGYIHETKPISDENQTYTHHQKHFCSGIGDEQVAKNI